MTVVWKNETNEDSPLLKFQQETESCLIIDPVGDYFFEADDEFGLRLPVCIKFQGCEGSDKDVADIYVRSDFANKFESSITSLSKYLCEKELSSAHVTIHIVNNIPNMATKGEGCLVWFGNFLFGGDE